MHPRALLTARVCLINKDGATERHSEAPKSFSLEEEEEEEVVVVVVEEEEEEEEEKEEEDEEEANEEGGLSRLAASASVH